MGDWTTGGSVGACVDGRTVGVVGTGPTLREALDLAYERVNEISFENAFYRRDIGKRALEA